jgi:catechol 2,3-dioxygenase-like lactoylglutathione lyase family enzyme
MRASHAIVLGLSLMGGTLGATPGNSPTVRESKFELFVTDAEESTRFYTTLGFVVAHRKPDGYTTLRSGSTVVALSPVSSWLPLRWLGFLRHPPLGTEIVLYSTRLEELRSVLDAAGYAPGEIRLQPWGDRDFRVTDYDGYYIRVSEGHAVPHLQ